MTGLGEDPGRLLARDSRVSPASYPPEEALGPVGERRVGWAAGGVFLVWVSLLAAWIFLAPPASTAAPALESLPVADQEPVEAVLLSLPTPTPALATRTPVPAVIDDRPDSAPILEPSPVLPVTALPPTPLHRSLTPLTLLEDEVQALTGTGNVVFLGMDNRVVALDVTDPTFPVWIGEVSGLPGPVQRLTIVSEHIYALHPGGVSVLDITEPGDLLSVGYVETDPGLLDLVPGSDRLFGLAGGDEGSSLQVFHVGTPRVPRASGSVEIAHEPFDFIMFGARGYLTHGPWLTILDLEKPEAIQPLATYEFPGAALSVAANQHVAFVGVAGSGVYWVGLEEPAALEILSVVSLDGNPVSIKVLYDGILMVMTDSRVLLLDGSRPEAFQLIGAYELPGQLRDVELFDEIALIAMGESGMLVLDLSQ